MRWSLNVLLVGLALTSGSAIRAEDKVTYIDRYKSDKEKKNVTSSTTGSITDETAGRILIKSAISNIPSVDVVDVYYKIPATPGLVYRAADNAELDANRPATKPADRKKALQKALESYQKLQTDPSLKSYKFPRRHFQYKIARLTVRLAGDDKAKRKAAADLLIKFKTEHPNSWQLFGCLETLAELQQEAGDFKGAAEAYDELVKMKDLSANARKKFQLAAAQALVKAGEAAAAEGRLNAVLKTIKQDDPQYFRLQMTLAQCQAAQKDQVAKAIANLTKIVAGLKDTETLQKAIALNTLGDCCLAGNRPKDALYAYLNVDLYYSGDRDEHRKACAQIVKLFEMLGEKQRVKEYQEKLERLKN